MIRTREKTDMSGWYVVYLMTAFINGALLCVNDYTLSNWQFWVWMLIPVITYIAGREVERGK